MKISETAISRPILASMVIGAMVVFGWVSYKRIGVDYFPNVDMPVVTVSVVYEGADPETVETDVVDVIEESVNTISGVKKLTSQSVEGLGQVFIEFELEVDVDIASQEVRDKVATIRGDLPLEIESPVVQKFDLDSGAILSIVLSGPVGIRELTEYADDNVKPRLESVSGVGNVRLVGQQEREIRIWLRRTALKAHGLTAQDFIDALEDENVEPPGGRVESRGREMIVKTKGKVRQVEDFEKIVVAYRDGAPIRVRDLAWIEDGMEDCRSLARLDGRRAVSLLVRRQSGVNMVSVADGVKERLAKVQENLPPGYDLTIAQDLSVFVNQSISEAKGELLRGGLLAVVVIFFFLRSLRGSFVAAITIPTTIISTFMVMYTLGFTINMMTMLALTISVGMVIDDSIVVLENATRHIEAGKSRFAAAREAMSEIGVAVIATSLAVLAVFVPVAFMDGIVGRFFFEFGLTVSAAVFISTFIAVTLSPMLCSRVLKKSPKHGPIFSFVERSLERIEGGYRRVLRFALNWRITVVVLSMVMFVASLGITFFIGKEFAPEADEGQFNVQIQAPVGTSLAATNDILTELERRFRTLPNVKTIFTTIGGGDQERVNTSTILVRLDEKEKRTLSQFDIMAMTRQVCSDMTHLKISVEIVPRIGGSSGGFQIAPVQYNLHGENLEELDKFSEKMIDQMGQKIAGLVDLNSSYDNGKPEVNVLPNRDKAADLGVSVRDIGRAVQTLIGGRKVGKFEEGGETYDLRVRLVNNDRNRPETILDLPVRSRSGELVNLRNLVEVQRATGPVQIDRENRSRKITVFANLEKTKPLASAVEDITKMQNEIGLPPGVETKFGGDAEMMEESFASIGFSLMLGIVLIYMVLAAQFESLVHPFTVMLSLPLSIVGALGLLALTGRTLNIFSMIGMIMLMGLVTKNAILLIDYTNLLRSKGLGKTDALLQAGPVRLRPILMTALSTIAGMLPVVFGLGSGAETRAPMGTAIVGGMITSTILTLVVIPVVYSLMDDLSQFAGRLVRLGRSEKSTPEFPISAAAETPFSGPHSKPQSETILVELIPDDLVEDISKGNST
jgi:hydrophobic/amphiphilic exporter-1 (mainly G- bacteria), HAE1 family